VQSVIDVSECNKLQHVITSRLTRENTTADSVVSDDKFGSSLTTNPTPSNLCTTQHGLNVIKTHIHYKNSQQLMMDELTQTSSRSKLEAGRNRF